MDASKIVKADTAAADPLGAPRKCLRDAARDPGRREGEILSGFRRVGEHERRRW